MKKIIIAIIVVLLLGGGAFAGFVVLPNTPSFAVKRAVEKQDVEKVNTFVSKNKDKKDKMDEAKKIIVDHVNTVYDNYVKDAVDYDVAKKELDVWAKVEFVASDVSAVAKKCDDMKKSKENYTKGMELIEKKSYSEAFPKLELVIAEDPNSANAKSTITSNFQPAVDQVKADVDELVKGNNYSGAKTMITDMKKYGSSADLDDLLKSVEKKEKKYKEKLEKQHKKKIQNTLKWIQATYGKSFLCDTYTIQFQNTSDKTIDEIDFTMECYDSAGNRVKYAGADLLALNSTDNVAPGATTSQYWELPFGISLVLPNSISIKYEGGGSTTITQEDIVKYVVRK